MASPLTFHRKQDEFIADLEVLFNVAEADGRKTIQNSGIKDWGEEQHYLQNQLSREQFGCPWSWDFRQKKRDDRKLRAVEKSTSTFFRTGTAPTCHAGASVCRQDVDPCAPLSLKSPPCLLHAVHAYKKRGHRVNIIRKGFILHKNNSK